MTADQAQTNWYLTTALIIGLDGAPSAISSIALGEDEDGVRLRGISNILNEYGPRGFALREFSCAKITGLTITVDQQPEAVQEVQAPPEKDTGEEPLIDNDGNGPVERAILTEARRLANEAGSGDITKFIGKAVKAVQAKAI